MSRYAGHLTSRAEPILESLDRQGSGTLVLHWDGTALTYSAMSGAAPSIAAVAKALELQASTVVDILKSRTAGVKR